MHAAPRTPPTFATMPTLVTTPTFATPRRPSPAPPLLGALALAALAALGACGGDADPPPTCTIDLGFEHGGDGVAAPLEAPSGQARAGRAGPEMLPALPSGLGVWSAGDFILANERIALVIEDAGPSDLYDPWGGKPIGLGRVENGILIEPGNFGEILLLVGRNGVLVDRVSVLRDGQDGGPAVVRASGRLAPLPFFDNITANIFRETFAELRVAIDYELAPGSEHVDMFMTLRSPKSSDEDVDVVMHGLMYTYRAPLYAPGLGFGAGDVEVPYAAYIDEGATSWIYEVPGQPLGAGISAAGFVSKFTSGYSIARCAETRVPHARLIIGGPGLGGVLAAKAREDGVSLRTISGTVKDGAGAPAAGVSVHATDGNGGYLTRATSDAQGRYAVQVAGGQATSLTAFRRGEGIVGPLSVGADRATQDFDLPAAGAVHVTVTDAQTGTPLPARVQILPVAGGAPTLPPSFGEPGVTGGRVHVAFPAHGDVTLPIAAGTWRLVVSRGYDYDLVDEIVTVAPGQTVSAAAKLTRVVESTGVMCADFHIHTHRSNDSSDDATLKVRAAVADGLEIPVRSEHEYVADFQPIIEALGLHDFAFGMGSIEMTSMEIWGHMGVVPLVPDPALPNAGAPLWQTFPTAAAPDVVLRTMEPPEVFDLVRARPEQPIVIINHPRGGGNNYFDYAQYDPATGTAGNPVAWDERFGVVEFFNDASWPQNRQSRVVDWLSFLNRGRRVFAVGSSDSHEIASSPVGYPRTCLAVGTDDPRALTPALVRDTVAAGRATISGGISVDARVQEVGPGGDAKGLGPSTKLHVRVQAPTWVDVDSLEIVVDGQTFESLSITPGDADPQNPVIRLDKDFVVPVASSGSYVLVAAWGSAPLEPVHPGRQPFGVTNPIFLWP
jgi:hypothetical protein